MRATTTGGGAQTRDQTTYERKLYFLSFPQNIIIFYMLPPFQISYDYMIGDGRGDEEDDGGVDVITPFSTSTFRPVTYDYNIGRGEEEEDGGDRLSFVTESPTSRRPPPVYFGPDIPSSPSLLPTLRPATLLKNRQ